MDKTLKEKWLKALRSGDYQQGKGYLLQAGLMAGKFCCLGVLADVAGARWEERDTASVPYLNDECLDSDEESLNQELSRDFLSQIDLEQKHQTTLINFNDGISDGQGQQAITPKTFSEIADWIEENL